MKRNLITCVLLVLLCGANSNHMMGMRNKDKRKNMPPIAINCNQGTINQKVQNLLNQDLPTLRTYFNEKCAMENSICKSMTVQEAEEKICELRQMKARLFPQGTNNPALSITSFDCNKYTAEEKGGCPPRPRSPTTTSTTGTSGTAGATPVWPFSDGAGSSVGSSPVWPFTDNRGGNAQPAAQTIRNNWDTVIQEKVQEYKDKMQAYRSMNRNGPFGVYSQSGGGSAYGGSSNSQGIPGNFVGFQANPQGQPAWGTWPGSSTSNQQGSTSNQYSTNSPSPYVSPNDGQSDTTNRAGGYSAGYPIYGGGSSLGKELYRQAMELRRCLPPGSIREDNKMGAFYSPYFGEPAVPDPLLVICRLRDNPKHFEKLEERIMEKFTEYAVPQCGSYTAEINAAVNRMLRATDPVDYMRQEMTQSLTLQKIIVKKCALKELYKKLKENDAATTNLLNCNSFQQQLQQFKTEAKVKEMMMQMDYDPYRSVYRYQMDPMKKLMKSLYCESQAKRNLIYSKFGNMQLVICLTMEKINEKSMPYYEFMEKFSGYLDVVKKLYLIRQVDPNPLSNGVVRRILANLYEDITLEQLGLSTDNQPLTLADWLSQKRAKLTTANAVFGAQNPATCNNIYQNSKPARNFQQIVATAITDCQKGNKNALDSLFDKANEISKQVSESTLDNNRLRLCMAYTIATSLPDSSGTLSSEFEKLMFAKKLFMIVEKEVKKARNSPSTLNNNCETQMTPNAEQSLDKILTKFASGELAGLKEDMQMMMNPTDANAPLTEDQRKTYMACKARKVYNLSTGQMCQAFAGLRNTVSQNVRNRMTEFRNGGAIEIKKEIALILMTPSNPTVVTPSTQSLGSCTGNRQVTPQGLFVCPTGIQCCANQQAVCDNQQCRFTSWQETFCKHAAAAQGKSNSDPYSIFMKMMKKGDMMRKQEMYSYYMKFSKNSADCQTVFGTSSTSNSQSNTANLQSGAIWPFSDNVGSPSSSSGSSSLPFPFNVNVGAQAPSSTSAGYDQYRSMLDTSAFNSGGSYSMVGPYPGMRGPECSNTDRKKKFFCAWHMVYDTWKSSACPNTQKQNPLFPDYSFYDPDEYQIRQCQQNSEPSYSSVYRREKKNRDCQVYTKAQEKSAATGMDTGFFVMMEYKNRYGGLYSGVAYRGGGENTYQSGGYSSNYGGGDSGEHYSMAGGNYGMYGGGNSDGEPKMTGRNYGGNYGGNYPDGVTNYGGRVGNYGGGVGSFGGGAPGGNYGGGVGTYGVGGAGRNYG